MPRALGLVAWIGLIALLFGGAALAADDSNGSNGEKAAIEDDGQGFRDNLTTILTSQAIADCPLVAAARDGNLKRVQTLLDGGEHIDKPIEGITALWIAAALGREKVVSYLLENDADVDALGPIGMTPLMAAAEAGFEGVVSDLVDYGADIEARQDKGCTALILATIGEHPRVVKVLTKKGADVNAQSYAGLSSLIVASYMGNLYIVKSLIAANAAVDLPDSQGATSLFVASQEGYELIVHQLLQAGAQTQRSRLDGATSLHAAAAGCHQGIIELLLDAGANPDVKDIYNYTAADHLQREKCKDEHTLYIVEALLRPLFLAAREGEAWVVSRLIENGRDVNSVLNSNGMTPLHVAAAHGRLAVVEVLLQYGADRDVRDSLGARAIDVVGRDREPSEEDHEKIKQLLLDDPAVPVLPPVQFGQENVVVTTQQQPRAPSNTNSFTELSMLAMIGVGVFLGILMAAMGGLAVWHIYWRPPDGGDEESQMVWDCGRSSCSSHMGGHLRQQHYCPEDSFKNPLHRKGGQSGDKANKKEPLGSQSRPCQESSLRKERPKHGTEERHRQEHPSQKQYRIPRRGHFNRAASAATSYHRRISPNISSRSDYGDKSLPRLDERRSKSDIGDEPPRLEPLPSMAANLEAALDISKEILEYQHYGGHPGSRRARP